MALEIKVGPAQLTVHHGRSVLVTEQNGEINAPSDKGFSRGLSVRPYNNDSPVVYANGRLSFEIAIGPGASWHSCLSYEVADGEQRFKSPINCIEHTDRSKFWKDLDEWQHSVLKIRT